MGNVASNTNTQVATPNSGYPPPNFIFFSCHFPYCHRYLAQALKANGVRVLGIGDESYELLHPDLKGALTEYYKMPNLSDYDQLHRAVGYFIHKYGRVQFFESFIEHWQEAEARVRTDFNIEGYDEKIMQQYKRKSGMKVVYRAEGLPVAPGVLPTSLTEAKQFANEVGYPLIMKPDMGVGAIGAKKINTEEELAEFWMPDYFIEKFIFGDIETFDGLTNHNGDLVFWSSMTYNPIMEVLTGECTDISFYIKPDVPKDLLELGEKVVKAFQVKARIFHAEFFRTKEGQLLCLEINLRPPGAGYTLDMWNFTFRMDLYKEYANVIAKKPTTPFNPPGKNLTAYCGRRSEGKYVHTVSEIRQKFGKKLENELVVPPVFSAVMGNFAYIFTCDTLEEMRSGIQYIAAEKK